MSSNLTSGTSPAATSRDPRLKEDFIIGRGHAMALLHVIKNGPQISEKHVATDGVHRDESVLLHLDGIATR